MAAKKKAQSKSAESENKSRILVISGLVLAVFTIYTFISCTSYLFTWKADQSIVSNAASAASNAGGRLGHGWGGFLVNNCFGLGSYALVVLLAMASVFLIRRKKPENPAKTALLVLFAGLISSAVLSFVGGIVSPDTCFGGGLGGNMGSAISGSNGAMTLAMGNVGTALILGLCVIIWLLFVSGSFARWMANPTLPKRRIKESLLQKESAVEEDVVVVEAEDIAVPDSVVDSEPEEIEPVDEPDREEQVQDDQVPEGCEITPDDIVYQDGDESVISMPEDAEEDDVPGTTEATVVEGDDFTAEVQELERYDNRAELEKFKYPSIDLLDDYASGIHKVPMSEIENNNRKIQMTLQSYKIQVESVSAIVGPTVTLYKVKLAPGMKSASVKNIEKDIAMSLGNESVRVTTLADAVGIEVANEVKSIVPLKAMFNDPSFRESKAELPVALGYTITQKVKTFDLADAPHLLVAGATKQGKSVGLNVIVASLLYSKHPSELKLVFVDPKMVEFTAYKRLLKHYLAVLPGAASETEEEDNAIVKDHKKADEVLKSLCIEMDERYLLLSKAGVNKLVDYNEKFKERHLNPNEGHRYLPYLVVVIDEYADLIMAAGGADGRAISKGVTTSIIRLAQKGRAAGIHVIIATQRPSVDVITGLIKTNFPTRIAFRVVTRVDSGTILDSPGAEKLIGRGDMLYYEGIKMERVQCAYVSTEEINAITRFIGDQTGYKAHYNTPYYLPEVPVEGGDGEGGASGMVDMHKLDSNFEEAARLVVSTQKGSTSDIQRRLGMGYARAGKVMDQLEAAGIVGPQEGSKPRQVLVADYAELDRILESFGVK